jgi:hypothetical protein
MNRCKQCIMPESVPGIAFNEYGICNLCLGYKEGESLGEKEFNKLIESIRNQRSKYDCIVPVSGGRDSSYILYAAKKLYNLRVLAVNYDNEFRNDQAIINIRTACSKLGVDLLEVRSKRNIAKKIVRSEIRLVLYRGPLAVSEVLCTACAYGYKSVVYRAAIKYKVPLILWGESQVESTYDTKGIFRKALEKKAYSRHRLRKFVRLFDMKYYRLRYYHLIQRIEFHVPGNSILATGKPELKKGNIREVRFFDYIPWNRNVIKKTITKELDWKKPANSISTWRTDCAIPMLLNYCFFCLFGCSKNCFGYCNMINSGQMGREEALSQENALPKGFTEDLRILLKNKIGLLDDEIAYIETFHKKGV